MSFEADYATEGRFCVANTSVQVIRCTNRRTGEHCVAKVYNRQKFSEHRISLSLEEGAIGLSIPPHPSVVRTLACYNDPAAVSIVMEYMPGGTLYQALTTTGVVAEARAGKLVASLLTGLAHLHSNKIMHRDIKPENLFLSKSGAGIAANSEVLAIGDFGFATRQIPSDQCVGSPQYSAPELALIALQHHTTTKTKPLFNEKCDIWSTGIVTYVMLTGLMPFDGASPTEVFQQVVKNQIPFHLPACRRLSPSCKEFILSLTSTNPSKRPSAKDALRHPWIVDCLQSR